MNLCQPYYIEKRENHISLNGKWDFCWTDEATEEPEALPFAYSCNLPHSVYDCLYRAGVLPAPYYGTNSREYRWVDEKVWYFRKSFSLRESGFDGNAYLCFEGVSYYCRVWVNGRLLGDHEGMFGGPCCDIREHLNCNGENELVVEVKACNYGQKETYDSWNCNGQNREIVPWAVTHCNLSGEDFITFGIWNEVRLELLPKMHLSRPYLYTKSVAEDQAVLHFEVELADGRIPELRKFLGSEYYSNNYTRSFDTGLTGAILDTSVEIAIRISDNDECVWSSAEQVSLTDFDNLGMDRRYYELQFYQKEIQLSDPKLWYPNGMGDPFLYDITITLSADGRLLDTHSFSFGVRTFTADYTQGGKYRTRWEKFLFSVNGKPMFLKGMNWMPIDFLYDMKPERYEWCLSLAKNAGIQLLRVWNGGGIPETDTFYELCDKMGILVWQDQYIANTSMTQNFPLDVLECQTAYNLYRIRNHPSLVILCGGNEFIPYIPECASSLYVMEKTSQTLIPDRIYHPTTADKGSAHIYIDMEPVWYRHRYKQLPFLAESGIHSFPNFKTLRKFICEKEATASIKDLAAPEFAGNFPDLLNHFAEYQPDRVPRMTARMSQIIDMSDTTLKEMCEASQVQVYEFYQLMIQSMQENYPVCGGIMPWVFKRPWPTAGTQTVDGDDRPGYGYYAVQNAYRPVNVCWCQQWSVLAPEEEISLMVKTFNQNKEDLSDTEIILTVYNPDLTVWREYKSQYQDVVDFGSLKLDSYFTNTCFLVCADISRNGVSVSRSVYFNKCTELFADETLYQKYRSQPTENLYFQNGPWLKNSIQNAKQTVLRAERIGERKAGSYHYADLQITNDSDIPAYPVMIEQTSEDGREFLSDNFFLLKPGETKLVRITCDAGEVDQVKVSCWNGQPIIL